MPYKRYAGRRKKGKKSGRGTRRKSKGSIPRALVPRGTFATQPFPSTVNRVLTYSDSFYTLTQANTNVLQTAAYSGNNLYDPDLPEVGNQPKYFDTFCGAADGTAPYRSFRVLASKIKVTFMPDPTLSAANNLMTAFVMPIDSSGGYAPTSIVDVMERPNCKYVVLGNTGAAYYKTISMYCRTRAIFGSVDPLDPDYQADYNTEPPRKWQWYMGICNIQAGGLAKCILRVQIKYYCQFFNLNRVAQS